MGAELPRETRRLLSFKQGLIRSCLGLYLAAFYLDVVSGDRSRALK